MVWKVLAYFKPARNSNHRFFSFWTFMGALGAVWAAWPQWTWGWGQRGHALICEVAISLIADESLRQSLARKWTFVIHGCNLPDTDWRQLPENQTIILNPTHYFDLEHFGTAFSVLPDSFEAFWRQHVGKKSLWDPQLILDNKDFHKKSGSLPWRLNELYQQAVMAWERAFSQPQPPAGPYEALVVMAILGHFVGDGSQPLHLSADFDGWKANKGGIHEYFEDELVAALPSEAAMLVEKAAWQWKSTPGPWNHKKIQWQTWLQYLQLSFDQKAQLLLLDQPLEASGPSKPAKRVAATKDVHRWAPWLYRQLGLGALMLSHVWQQAFQEGWKKNQSRRTLKSPEEIWQNFKDYRYPYRWEPIVPSYLPKNSVATPDPAPQP